MPDNSLVSRGADDDELSRFGGDYDWLILDTNRAGDMTIYQAIRVMFPKITTEAPEERWEDGDCYCGIREEFDFRPVVDPDFLNPESLRMVFIATDFSEALDWALRLYFDFAY